MWQSYVPFNGKASTVDAWGAWGNLVYKPAKKWQFVIGTGIDDPEDDDFHGNGSSKRRNTTTFGNVTYSLYKGATVGLEYDRMVTDYVSRRIASTTASRWPSS